MGLIIGWCPSALKTETPEPRKARRASAPVPNPLFHEAFVHHEGSVHN